MEVKRGFAVGDVLVSRRQDGDWMAVKILAVDAWPDEDDTLHCLVFQPTAQMPTAESFRSPDDHGCHGPISAAGFAEGWEVLCTSPVEDDDMVGFIEYLRMTDFRRYLEVTQQDGDALVAQANAHYQAALALDNDGMKLEAIDAYTQAIELFPLFFEAIDNRAFLHMELGDYATALSGFEDSLQVNPDGNSAFFSRGECLLRLGRLEEAQQVFEEGKQRFPEHQDMYIRYLAETLEQKRKRVGTGAAEAVARSTVKKRPWWKPWN
ncbi:tetratricopeptide repeat protein [Stenotrophomonas rhizophila]|uniref:tetratricopeptide repeat protein n=1 Tax=Stenotrophomonas rhizophila TaxID=216778 RepID=UPI001E354433|nr:tetratricopeptide repeat protein [Stenotrophomonas rhizophila]MCC7634327.1 tetratricopeptide repeat protein [Stenotrophomonas rhizophila]MCC7664021.1 tetratricopeptide repeat protein [Stenotrophomonas rhizophila]